MAASASHPRLKYLSVQELICAQFIKNSLINPLAPSDPSMGRTAQLTSRCCILNTYSTNIRTEYFKRAA
jgi:hypothetical protein